MRWGLTAKHGKTWRVRCACAQMGAFVRMSGALPALTAHGFTASQRLS